MLRDAAARVEFLRTYGARTRIEDLVPRYMIHAETEQAIWTSAKVWAMMHNARLKSNDD